MKTIVLHDYFKFMEGGGRLSLVLAEKLAADVGYGFKIDKHPYFDIYRRKGRQYDLKVWGGLPGVKNLGLIHAFRKKTGFLKQYQTAIYSGFYAPLAVMDHGAEKNFYYCHTPPRYVYDQREFYLSRYPWAVQPLIRALAAYHRSLYEVAIKKMDRIITNSRNVQGRIQKYLRVEAAVVYPPCETSKFQWIGQQGFYLSAARLDPLKRVDLIVEAFTRMPDKRLIVVSDGPEEKTIRQKASGHANITMLGRVSDQVYRRLMGECIATIYLARDEDFGMTPIESMASGKPVIGVDEGGLKESILAGETGILLDSTFGVADVMDAVRRLDASAALKMRAACHHRAQTFDVDRFMINIEKMLF